jgi:hypothetical protein
MAAAAATDLTNAEQNMLDQMRFHAQNLIVSVSRTGSGTYNSDVLDFQNAWNSFRATITSLLRRIGSSQKWFSLVEDGKYGPNTSRAVTYFLPSGYGTFPTRAAQMPVWYAQHESYVDGLVPPSSPPLQSVIDGGQVDPNATHDQAAVEDAINASGSTVRNVVPVGIPASSANPPGPPQVVNQNPPQGPPAYGPQVTEVVNSMSPSDPAAEIINMDFDAEQGSHVVGTRVASRIPWLATAIGAVGLGGVLYYWTKKKKR